MLRQAQLVCEVLGRRDASADINELVLKHRTDNAVPPLFNFEEPGELGVKRGKALNRRNKSGSVFGVPLNTLMFEQSQTKPNLTVPYLLTFLKGYMFANGGELLRGVLASDLGEALKTEGIFRINGNTSSMKRAMQHFNIGDYDESMIDSVHTAAHLLKTFLREFPEPLIPQKQ